jgi:hypothetical protein
MKICSVCHKISGSGQDHLDCIQKRRVELEDDDFKSKITEKLELSKNPQDLGVEVKAILRTSSKRKRQ